MLFYTQKLCRAIYYVFCTLKGKRRDSGWPRCEPQFNCERIKFKNQRHLKQKHNAASYFQAYVPIPLSYLAYLEPALIIISDECKVKAYLDKW